MSFIKGIYFYGITPSKMKIEGKTHYVKILRQKLFCVKVLDVNFIRVTLTITL